MMSCCKKIGLDGLPLNSDRLRFGSGAEMSFSTSLLPLHWRSAVSLLVLEYSS